MKTVAVLGAGMVGRTIAKDLAADGKFRVLVADRRAAALEGFAACGIEVVQASLNDADEVRRVLKDADLAVNAVPGALGFNTLKTVLEEGTSAVDIAFMPEDSLRLDGVAKGKEVTAVVDCGVAPGLSNLLCGRGVALMDKARSCRILVGGLPAERTRPWEYKAPFSPADVLEEYTRTARIVQNGRIVERPPLSDLELVEFERIGTLEAFLTDGLRTLTETLAVPDMVEKTLRYPGYAANVMLLKDTGFFGTDPMQIREGVYIRPLDLTSRLLFDAWRLRPGDREFTVLRVEVSGLREGKPATVRFDLHDETDPVTGTSSMSRTTGFPAAIMARMVLDGRVSRHGVIPPELLGADTAIVQTVLAELRRRGVDVKESWL